MAMAPGFRRFALTAHVASSVGWLGAVLPFLALAIAGLASSDVQVVRATYLAMKLIAWFVILPLCLASLLTGLVSSLGTPWGLVRQYWVLLKLLITVSSTFLLLMHMQPIDAAAGAAAQGLLSDMDLRGPRIQLVVESGAALLALLVATALSTYKPKGMTRYGWSRQQEQRAVFSELTK